MTAPATTRTLVKRMHQGWHLLLKGNGQWFLTKPGAQRVPVKAAVVNQAILDNFLVRTYTGATLAPQPKRK